MYAWVQDHWYLWVDEYPHMSTLKTANGIHVRFVVFPSYASWFCELLLHFQGVFGLYDVWQFACSWSIRISARATPHPRSPAVGNPAATATATTAEATPAAAAAARPATTTTPSTTARDRYPALVFFVHVAAAAAHEHS